MYKIIGADGRPYGPATAETLREWIAAGRANAQTMAQAEGAADWKPLSAFPEFADALGARAIGPPPPPVPIIATASEAEALANEILARDYTLDVFSCFSRAWEKIKSDFWPIIGVSAVIVLLLGVSGAAYVAIIIGGPLLGGLYWFYLKLIRGQKAEMGDAFAGFTLAFLQLFLGSLASGLLAGVGLLFCVLPGIYLAVAWKFTLPLIVDKRMEFWPAMELSRKVITKHWWEFFGLAILSSLLNLAGFLLCCVGTFVTVPITMLALMYAYEDIFGPLQPQSLKPL